MIKHDKCEKLDRFDKKSQLWKNVKSVTKGDNCDKKGQVWKTIKGWQNLTILTKLDKSDKT